MLKNLTILGFRTFRELHVDRLKRVNLFVGTNNSGKTSVLEAAELLAEGTARALLESPSRRGEHTAERDPDLSHLFHGHALQIGSQFSIESGRTHWVRCEISRDVPFQESLFGLREPFSSVKFNSHLEERILPISQVGGIKRSVRAQLPLLEVEPAVRFLGTGSFTADDLSQLWDDIVLTPEEDQAAAALRIIEPRIERIAFLVEQRRPGGIFLKLADSEQRLPLGSTGDGLKRLLALALHLLSARGGYLLVDEIDTGLHYSVMENMWKLVIETARRIDAQVLATTHSLDCVRALAWVRESNPHLSDEVALHRIEKDLPHTVEYSLDELAIAAHHHVEVR